MNTDKDLISSTQHPDNIMSFKNRLSKLRENSLKSVDNVSKFEVKTAENLNNVDNYLKSKLSRIDDLINSNEKINIDIGFFESVNNSKESILDLKSKLATRSEKVKELDFEEFELIKNKEKETVTEVAISVKAGMNKYKKAKSKIKKTKNTIINADIVEMYLLAMFELDKNK